MHSQDLLSDFKLYQKKTGVIEPNNFFRDFKRLNEMENRCIKLFYQALQSNITEIDASRIINISVEIVNDLLINRKLDDSKLIRSKLYNLKDKSNPDLALRIYNGIISSSAFVRMTSEEMKSDRMKDDDNTIQEKYFAEKVVPKLEAETNIFKCSKCGERKCSYRQLQTRSADEPMTTFVQCVCGHRWKFS